jgi:hypothetical protein
MLPGPLIIIECPFCKSQIKIRTLASYNTIGAAIRSDGKIEAPMYREEPELAKCNKCRHFYWIKKARIVEKIDWFGNESSAASLKKYDKIGFIKFPTIKEYFESLNEIKYNQKYIRLQIWRLYNNFFRIDKKLSNEAQIKYNENAYKLISLLNTKIETEKIIKAELYRNLGNLKQSKKITDQISSEYDFLKIILVREISILNKYTVELQPPAKLSDAVVFNGMSDEIYLLDCEIAGTYYQNINKIYSDLIIGEKLTLKRESNNEYDKYAVSVYNQSNVKLGYIPRNNNKIIAKLMDEDLLIYYSSLNSKNSDYNHINLEISIYFFKNRFQRRY